MLGPRSFPLWAASASLAAALGAAAGATWAQSDPPSFGPRPGQFLERRISQGQFVEQYVSQVMTAFRQADVGLDGLDAHDVATQRLQREAQDRAQIISQVLKYDLNGDLVVTPDEIATFAQREGDQDVRNMLERFDVDGDGRVTLKEMLESSARISRVNESRRIDEAEAMMELPEARDGLLTAGELESAARAMFAKADTNGDGRISREENQQFHAALPPGPPREPVNDVYCPMPPANAGDLIVLFGSYEGQMKPGDPQPRTGTATINVEPGRRPIYLVLPSYSAIRWTLTGATGRVRQVVLSSYSQGSSQTPRGVDGVPQQRVRVFGYEGCVRYFYKHESPETAAAKAAVALRLGRQADVVAGAYKATDISLPSAQALPKAGVAN